MSDEEPKVDTQSHKWLKKVVEIDEVEEESNLEPQEMNVNNNVNLDAEEEKVITVFQG